MTTHPLAHHVDSGTLPGLVLAVVRDGDVRVDALGDLARDAIVRISSMTKPVVAVAALLLVEDGVLGLDEPLDDLLPELAGRPVLRTPDAALDDTVPLVRPLTLRDVLTSRMGHGAVLAPCPVADATAELGVAIGPPGRPRPGPDEFLARLGSLPLLAQPGAAWFYDTPFDVLGVLLARATGTPLPDLLRARILDPLAMRDTGFHVPAAALPRLAPAYGPGLTPFDDPADSAWAREPEFVSGAGGLVSTVDDFLAFTEALRGGSLLPPAVVAAMTSDQLAAGQGDPVFLAGGMRWGFGVGVGPEPGRYGWPGGLGTAWTSSPSGTGVLLTQLSFGDERMASVYEDFLAASASVPTARASARSRATGVDARRIGRKTP